MKGDTVVEIKNNSVAGTLESSDCMVWVSPGKGLNITVNSAVYQQFGESIEKTVEEVVNALGVTDAEIQVKDTGAIDCVIKARVETAIKRAAKEAVK